MTTPTPELLRRRFGTDEALPEVRTLTAGPLQAEFRDGGLRTIRFDGIEVLRAVAYVVRDKDWGTYAPSLCDCRIKQDADGFRVGYSAACVDRENGPSLDYEARIVGTPDGRLVFDVVVTPRADFLTARCGFAVLHPLATALPAAPCRRARLAGGHQARQFCNYRGPGGRCGD